MNSADIENSKRIVEERANRDKFIKGFADALHPRNAIDIFGDPMQKAASGLDTKTSAQVESATKGLDAAIETVLGVKIFGDSSIVRSAAQDLKTAITATLNPTSGKTASGELRKSVRSSAGEDLRTADQLLARCEKTLGIGDSLGISFARGAISGALKKVK